MSTAELFHQKRDFILGELRTARKANIDEIEEETSRAVFTLIQAHEPEALFEKLLAVVSDPDFDKNMDNQNGDSEHELAAIYLEMILMNQK